MPPRDRRQTPDRLMILGFLALAVANVGQYLLHRSPILSESVTDGVSGFLFGVAIATLLLSIVVRVRASSGRGCAS